MHLLHVLHLLLALILSTLAITVAATAPEQQQQRIIGPIHVWVELFDNANFRGASFQGMVVTKLCHGVGQRRGRVCLPLPPYTTDEERGRDADAERGGGVDLELRGRERVLRFLCGRRVRSGTVPILGKG